ncbi:MAG: PilZ domain-containing protein [Candidatus Omnitrophica bacterium]|nr:PilZ domain-containing protein [Candidatus Omnitrophota bacterium]MBU1047002.1 PilZ domain-containing protein [Candidatus Omnitrophota bacterium]MBU1889548.1 PilZ domain-containing protein [Candidatus Omnitrophota bacterium]
MGFFFFRRRNKVRKRESRILEPRSERKSDFKNPVVVLFMRIEGQSKIYELPHEKDFNIGSDPQNDLCLNKPNVFPFHAKITPIKDSYVLYNLLSKTGVRVNQHEIHEYKLRFGDRIEIGSIVLLFDLKRGYRRTDEFLEGAERRRAVRISPPLTLRFIVYSHNKAKEFVALIKDVSLEGVRIELEEKLLKGSMIEAQIYSPDLPSIDLIGTVVREVAFDRGGKILHEVGIQFLEMSDKSKERLHNYLVECISE